MYNTEVNTQSTGKLTTMSNLDKKTEPFEHRTVDVHGSFKGAALNTVNLQTFNGGSRTWYTD
jgi:hypothetical protein